ncbi:MAG: helix-turn-helix transcriptional regulator [Symploca sp. SIO1C2]|nr:helix-turn-helix transcriptional regulator [Symploca sp. SIO1C2]
MNLAKEYLHNNFNYSISLEQLVQITSINLSYLIRIFRQATGMPPYTYLNQIRMRKAKQCLRKGMSIANTAIAVGMSDQSHLNHYFKKMFGITPGYYSGYRCNEVLLNQLSRLDKFFSHRFYCTS